MSEQRGGGGLGIRECDVTGKQEVTTDKVVVVIKRGQPITVNHLLSYCGSGEEKLQDGRQSNAGVTGQQQSFVIGNTTKTTTKESFKGIA